MKTTKKRPSKSKAKKRRYRSRLRARMGENKLPADFTPWHYKRR